MPTPNVSSKSNRINVLNLVYCLQTKDDTTGVTYGDVMSLAKAMTLQVTPTQATGVLYGDGAQQENIGKLTGIATKLEVNKIAIEDRAKLLGHKYQDGVLIKNTDDEAPYIALGYKVEGTNNCDEYVWLLKGRAQEINSDLQQQNDKINFSTDSLTLNFIRREYDGDLSYEADSANADFTSAQAAAWFLAGPSTYPTPTPAPGT